MKIPSIIRLLLVTAVATTFSACGTVSSLKNQNGQPVACSKGFNIVLVRDFQVKSGSGGGQSVGNDFARQIESEFSKGSKFSKVQRTGAPTKDTLVIDGIVTRYEEGSAILKVLIGLGFGMSYLDADVTFAEANGVQIGTIKVSKNSWPLGGFIAASQTPETMMKEAAQKIKKEADSLAK